MFKGSKPLLFLVLTLFLAGCATRKPATLSTDPLWDLYYAAVRDSSVIAPDDVHPLPAITETRVKVVTWTKWPYDLGQMQLKGTTWVSLYPVVQNFCKNYSGPDLELRLRQLMGLPPDSEKVHFVTFEVSAADLFRPCSSPDITTTGCDLNLPEGVSDYHARWFAAQMASSYQQPNDAPSPSSPVGYPWTRLGYTYDWNPKTSKVGPAELIARKDAFVNVLEITPTFDYCYSGR